MFSEIEGRVRKRAYEIWEAEGRPSGRDEEHWLRAVHEIEAERSEANKEEKPRSTKAATRKSNASAKAAGSTTKEKSVSPRATPKKGTAKIASAKDKEAPATDRNEARKAVEKVAKQMGVSIDDLLGTGKGASAKKPSTRSKAK